MKGSLILERVNDPVLRHEWSKRLAKLDKAMKNLKEMDFLAGHDPNNMEYMQAVLEFTDARDEERTFFWDTFVELRVGKKQQKPSSVER
jgi:hypothetical protein